jgi:hypothetical protein
MTKPISDKLLDQLRDEMRSMAVDLRSEARASCEDDDATANKNLAWTLDELATDRPLLVRFAFLLRSHSTRHGALAELTGAQVSA